MNPMRTIEIDFDVHKAIETARRGFEETPNDVLHRLLLNSDVKKGRAPTPDPVGRPWSWKGATLPHGTELRMSYNGSQYYGQISDGQWIVEGEAATSPSDAAFRVAKTRGGKHPSLNGWIYWEFRRPGDRAWKPIKALKETK